MRRSLRTLVVVVAAALALPGLAVAESWEIDPAHTLSGFTVRHLMVTNVRGSFDATKGSIEYTPGDPKSVRSGTTTSAPTTSSMPRSSRA